MPPETLDISTLQAPARAASRAASPADTMTAATSSLLPVSQVFLCDLTAKVLWGAAGLALIRFLPESEYASLTWALAISGLLIEGVSENLNRIYVIGDGRFHFSAAPVSFLTLQLAVLVVFILALGLFWQGDAVMVAWIAAVALSGSLLAFVRTELQRDLKFWRFSLVELARVTLFATALSVLVAAARGSLAGWNVLLLQAACVALVAAVALGRTLRRERLGRPRGAWLIARRIAGGGYALFIAYTLVLATLTRADVLMLKLLASELELATYGAAFRYYAMLALLLAAIHSVLLPLIQRATQREVLQAIFAKYHRAVLAIVPVVVLVAWISEWFIPLVDGGKYAGTVHVFRVLSIAIVIGLACSPHVHLLFRYGEFAFLLAVAGASLVVSIGLNAVLIPRYQALGAAVALCLATGAMNLMVYGRARYLLASRPVPPHAIDAIAALAVHQKPPPRNRPLGNFDGPHRGRIHGANS